MTRFCALIGLCAALTLGVALGTESAAAADDVFGVGSVKVDAIGPSAIDARDLAIAQGRPVAWTRLFRRLTREKDWSRQPALDDATLLRMIRGFEIAGEKRSSTHYLADITYEFNPAAVRALLQQTAIPYTETAAKTVLVIPVIAGAPPPFDPASAWTQAWAGADLADGLMPMVLPAGDAADMAILSQSEPMRFDWTTLAPLAARYGAGEVLVAQATAVGTSFRLNLLNVSSAGSATTPAGNTYATYAAAADAVARGMREAWKVHTATDYAQRSTLDVAIVFSSVREWASIRARLGAIPTIVNFDVADLSLTGAQVSLSYVGQLSQLQDALSQQNLVLSGEAGAYVIRSASPPATP